MLMTAKTLKRPYFCFCTGCLFILSFSHAMFSKRDSGPELHSTQNTCTCQPGSIYPLEPFSVSSDSESNFLRLSFSSSENILNFKNIWLPHIRQRFTSASPTPLRSLTHSIGILTNLFVGSHYFSKVTQLTLNTHFSLRRPWRYLKLTIKKVPCISLKILLSHSTMQNSILWIEITQSNRHPM